MANNREIRYTLYEYRESSYLRAYKAPLHLSRTLYKSATFMQNKPNFRKAKMNASIFLQMAYEYKHNWTLGQNKPNSNPIKPNFRKAKMNANSIITKDYRKKDDFAVRKNKPNSNPISVKPKMSANLYVIEDYENKTAFRPQKNKPNQTQFQALPYLPKKREEKRVSGFQELFLGLSCRKGYNIVLEKKIHACLRMS